LIYRMKILKKPVNSLKMFLTGIFRSCLCPLSTIGFKMGSQISQEWTVGLERLRMCHLQWETIMRGDNTRYKSR